MGLDLLRLDLEWLGRRDGMRCMRRANDSERMREMKTNIMSTFHISSVLACLLYFHTLSNSFQVNITSVSSFLSTPLLSFPSLTIHFSDKHPPHSKNQEQR
jgi:hypothetical protein